MIFFSLKIMVNIFCPFWKFCYLKFLSHKIVVKESSNKYFFHAKLRSKVQNCACNWHFLCQILLTTGAALKKFTSISRKFTSTSQNFSKVMKRNMFLDSCFIKFLFDQKSWIKNYSENNLNRPYLFCTQNEKSLFIKKKKSCI